MRARSKYCRLTLTSLATLASFAAVACQNDGRALVPDAAVPPNGPSVPTAASPSSAAGAAGPSHGSDCIGACGAAAAAGTGAAAGSGESAPAAGAPAAQEPGRAQPDPALSPGSAAAPPNADPDSELDCTEFRAHGGTSADDETPFEVPSGENYHCFYFDGPWDKAVQGVRVDALLGTKGLVHHVLLYSLSTPRKNGSSEACIGFHVDGTLIPGLGLERLPSDTGFEIQAGQGKGFLLEMHYINTGEPAVDRSGVRLCTAKKPRPRTATLTWLGSELIDLAPGRTGTATGSCTPLRAGATANQPIEIYMLSPHMHQLGRRSTTVIQRVSGATETVLDTMFDYTDPRSHAVQAKLEPGDTIETTCTYDNSTSSQVLFGPSVSDEMCYTFALAYPPGALDNPSLNLVGGQNTCFW
jgi:hypothetical protein